MTLVDGHNLYFALDRVDEENFEKGLSKLVETLRVRCRRGKTLLVLDGSGGFHPKGSEKSLSEHLRIVYSGQISADDWIENWLSRQGKSGVTLVTGDIKLYQKVSGKGLKRQDPVTWYKSIKEKMKASGSPSLHPRDKPSTVGSVDDWLEYFGEEE